MYAVDGGGVVPPRYTEAEEEFVSASAEFIASAEQLEQLQDRVIGAMKLAFAVVEELDTPDDREERLQYVHDLLVTAAERSGFGADSEVVQQMDEALAEVNGFFAELDAAAAQADTAQSNPVI